MSGRHWGTGHRWDSDLTAERPEVYRDQVSARSLLITEKGRRLLVRQEMELVFGSEPMPSGVPFTLVPRKEMDR